jgi:deazaflavin-dependent oxidoreductase (nitroreductase family)
VTRLRVLAVVLVLGATSAQAAESGEQPAVAAALAEIAGGSTVELSTIGRKTQRVHTRPVWYVVDGGRLYVQSGRKGTTDWYRNIQHNPGVTARAGRWTVRGTAAPVADGAEAERIRRLFLDKYTTAWLLSFVGSELGQGLPVAIVPETVTPRSP